MIKPWPMGCGFFYPAFPKAELIRITNTDIQCVRIANPNELAFNNLEIAQTRLQNLMWSLFDSA